jgi:hypothetical protein
LGSSQVYSVTNISGVTYTWTVPSGWTISSGQGTNSISTIVGSSSGNISVTPSNSCGSGTARTLAVTVNTVPAQPSTITGSTSPCLGSSQIYSVTNISGTTYTWTVPSGWTISSGQGTNSISTIVGSSSGNISVTPSNSCGSGTSRTLAITVNSVTANAGNDQTIPYGTSTTLNGAASNGSGSYTYHWEPASMLVNPNIQNPVTINLTTSVQFTLTVTDGVSGCTGSDQVLVTVTGGALLVTAVANPNEICEGNNSQLNAIASGGSESYTYSWTSNPVGFTSNIQNPVVYPTISTTYTVVVNDGSNSVTDDVLVTVNPLPGIPTVPIGPDTVDMKDITESQYTISALENATSYTWDLSPANAGTITGSGILGNVVWNFDFLGVASVKANAVNACGESEWSTEKHTVVENTVGIVTKADCELVVYPNPVSGDKITISFCYKMERIEIVEMNGITLISKQTESENYSLPHQLQSGVYFIKVVYNNGLMVKKIVVE